MKLLSPIKIGNLELKNRVVSTAHSAFLDFFQPGNKGEQYLAYQERRAQGGTGLLILTAMHVHKSSQCNAHYIPEEKDIGDKLNQLAERVHRHGTKVVSQLFHFGAQGLSACRDDLTALWGFSGTVTAFGEASHAMTADEIEEVIQGFADSARIVVSSGIDGVELHCTHGYLLVQSLSPWANKRKDEWGKPLHFLTTVARRVREAIGPDKVLGLRISADDFIPPEQGGLGHERLCAIAAELVGLGYFDYLNHSEGSGNNHYSRAVGSFRHKFGKFLPLTRGLREAIHGAIPVIGVGKIPTPDLAEQALQQGDCDLVGMTRAQIADPDLVRKLETGQAHRIRTCTGANQGCIDRTGFYPITCIQNPEVGQEYRLTPLEQVSRPKKVLIVGGGPAGMKAAELAARRGHNVTLAEAGTRLGGRFNLVESMGDATNLLSAIAWLEQELRYLKVPVETQTRVDEAFIKDFNPDAIILASGATPSVELNVDSDGSIPVISSDDAAAGLFEGQKFDMEGTRALVVDMRANYETALVTEYLVNRGARVTVATPFLHFAVNVGFTHMDDLLNTLPAKGCELLASTILKSVKDGVAELQNVYSAAATTAEFDFIVAGVHPTPNNALYEVASRHCRTIMAGDVVAPRSALEAFREGDRAGREV